MEEKLNEILDIYAKNHLDFYFNHTKEELDEYKNKLLNDLPLDSEYDLFYIVKLILKYMLGKYDSHTDIFYANYKRAGLHFQMINNSLYTVRTSDEFKDYAYKKLISINGIDIMIIVNEISKITNYSTYEFLEREVENYLNSSILNVLPMFRNCDILEYKFDDGTILNYDCTKEYKINHKRGDNCHYDICNDSIIFQYLSCCEPNDGYMKRVVEEFGSVIKEQNINNFVVDLRGNMGGNSEIIVPLLKFLDNSDLNIITLVDKYVYSSASIAVQDLKNIGSIFIGTDISTSLNHFGDIRFINGKFGNVEYSISVTFQYFYLDDNNQICGISNKEEFKKLDKEKLEPKYFHPDILVKESIEALKEGRDVYLEALNKYLDSKLEEFKKR